MWQVAVKKKNNTRKEKSLPGNSSYLKGKQS